MRRAFASLPVLVAALVIPTAARAQQNAACARAFDDAQVLRHDGKLQSAREQFIACSAASCPAMLRSECAKGLEELSKVTPSVVFAARDSRGADLVDVRVFIDGKPAGERLDGRRVEIDPGPHVFRFAAAGKQDAELKALLREGETGRLLSASLIDAAATTPAAASGPATGAPASASTTREAEPSNGGSAVPAIALMGLGAAALGTALFFDLDATSRVQDLRRTCAPTCADDDVNSVKRGYTVAAVLAGVGAVAVGVGVVLFVTRAPATPAPTSASLVLRAGPSGAAVLGRF